MARRGGGSGLAGRRDIRISLRHQLGLRRRHATGEKGRDVKGDQRCGIVLLGRGKAPVHDPLHHVRGGVVIAARDERRAQFGARVAVIHRGPAVLGRDVEHALDPRRLHVVPIIQRELLHPSLFDHRVGRPRVEPHFRVAQVGRCVNQRRRLHVTGIQVRPRQRNQQRVRHTVRKCRLQLAVCAMVHPAGNHTCARNGRRVGHVVLDGHKRSRRQSRNRNVLVIHIHIRLFSVSV